MEDIFTNKAEKKIRGVNLCGWLVLERWITPSLFEGLQAKDETGFCVELADKAKDRLHNHWHTFITEEDFKWLAQKGINAVKIPLGHWIFGSPYPYHKKYSGITFPFVDGGIEVLDSAFDWAEKYGILIQLDLHAAPGCQNGFDNGGMKDVIDWHASKEYISFSLDILERLAERYNDRKCLHAIEVLNAPHWDIPTKVLKTYTIDAYHRIRKHCKAADVAVMFHESFRSYKEWCGFMNEPDFSNVIYDIHKFQCFRPDDLRLDIFGHIQKTVTKFKIEADVINSKLGLRVFLGEWSLGLDLNSISLRADGPSYHALEHLDKFQTEVAYRAYGAAQLSTFEKYAGWFFTSYKTETVPAWSFRECVNRGWLPDSYFS